MGPKEQAVRATLPGRPAAMLYEETDLGRKIFSCFAGLFNGAFQGRITAKGGLFVGKAECEWDWQEVWPAMKELGLVDYSIDEVTHPSGYVSKNLHWNITEKGFEVRDDDIKYFRELMDAMAEDDPHVERTLSPVIAAPAAPSDPDADDREIADAAWR